MKIEVFVNATWINGRSKKKKKTDAEESATIPLNGAWRLLILIMVVAQGSVAQRSFGEYGVNRASDKQCCRGGENDKCEWEKN